jgi:hypothetical protein
MTRAHDLGAIFWTGCRSPQTPQVRTLSDQEAADLWNRAESREPVGEPAVRTIRSETGTTVVTTQIYLLRMAGGRPGGQLVTACTGSCLLKPGGTFDDCKSSGCFRSANSCTPLVCSGSCTLSSACNPAQSVGIFTAQ